MKLFGQVMLVTFIILFVVFDRQAVEVTEAEKKISGIKQAEMKREITE